ncbi:MAG: hypothetical protein LAO56_20130 [Acidobacteriia bacterium]|nr:hypothetical protein [Terriglobia bacterium]
MKSWKQLIATVFAAVLVMLSAAVTQVPSQSPVEAPTGFTTPSLSPGGGPGTQSVSNGLPEPAGDTFAEDQAQFEEAEGVDSGLGPVYNARACSDCHQDPVTGGSSQITEFRVGNLDRHGNFQDPTIVINRGQTPIPDRSLVNDRAICPEAQERAPRHADIHALRMSLSLLGDGFVEAIDDRALQSIAAQQPLLSNGRVHGELIQVMVLEAPGQSRAGRFGWKDQHASLLSFSADAYLNEQGVTSRLLPTDTTSVCKTTTDPEDKPEGDPGVADIDHFATFIRGTMAPPVDTVMAATPDARMGQKIFMQVGCGICHVPAITTAPAGTVINGGTFTVPEALGNKVIHPYGDFLLHDIGTGDGIVQNGPPDTANKLRTAPLWGLRTRARLMHDGRSTSLEDAILRHQGEAREASGRYRWLNDRELHCLLTFLHAL